MKQLESQWKEILKKASKLLLILVIGWIPLRSGSSPPTDSIRPCTESEPNTTAGAALNEAMGWIEYKKIEFKTSI